MTVPDPEQFAAEWAAAWNRRDIPAVLAHFADAATFTSPVASQLIEGSDGVLRGKDAIGEYWTSALARIPDLHFEVLRVYAGVDTLVINYRNQRGALVNEVLTFAGGLVVAGHGTYAARGDNLDGATD